MITAELLREKTTDYSTHEYLKQLKHIEEECKRASTHGEFHAQFSKMVKENVWWHVCEKLGYLGYSFSFLSGNTYQIHWSR